MFTLAISTMIASLSFAQAPAQKAKASDRQIQKVMSAEKMQQAMEVKAVREAKAQAAQETSGSVLRKAAKRPSAAVAKQMTAPKVIFDSQIARPAGQYQSFAEPTIMVPNMKELRTASSSARVNAQQAIASNKRFVDENNPYADAIDVVCTGYSAQYYASYGDWYIVLTDADHNQYVFDIYATELELGHTYTYADMDSYYTVAYVDGVETSAAAAEFTLAEVDGLKHVDAKMATAVGAYSISYTEVPAVEYTYGDWTAFAPNGSANGTYSFNVMLQSGSYPQDVENVQVRTAVEDENVKQVKVSNWGADFLSNDGVDFIIDWNAETNDCRVAPQATGYFYDTYDVLVGDITAWQGMDYQENFPCTFDPETATFSLCLAYYVPGVGAFGYSGDSKGSQPETLVMVQGGDEPGDEPADVTVTKDSNGIITSVVGGEPKSYARSAGSVYVVSSSGVSIGTQSGIVTVVEDGDKVYIKDPVCRFAQNSWVEGTKNGNMVIVPAGQPLTYNTNYATTISLRYGVVTAAGDINSADDYAENFVYVVDGDTWTLQNTTAYGNTEGDAYFMGAIWDDDNTMAGGEAETVLTYDPTYVAPSTDLVVLPNGAEVQPWTMNATSVSSSGSTPVMNQPVNVSFVGNDVYLQGVFKDFPTAWIKGTKDGSTVTFNKLQYIGNYGGSYDMYFAGTDGEGLTDATATLAADGQTITFTTDILANAATDRIYYLTWLENAVISSVPAEEPVITDLTAALPYFNGFDTEAEVAEAAIYDANGDGRTFAIAEDTKSGSQTVRYTYHSSNTGDDYVVFPGLSLQAGVSYKVSVDARPYGSTYPERVEVVAGTVAKASELTASVIPATELATGDYQTLIGEFAPEADGVYYFAIHAISDPDMFYLYADNFSVKENNPNTPAVPTALEVVADANAALAAAITAVAPAQTVGGEALAEVTLNFSRNGELIASETVAAGSTVTVNDTQVPAPGFYTYSVVAVAGDLVSDAVSAKVYVGEDIPDDVENLVATDLSGKVGLSWSAPVDGVNAGIIIPENLKYNVYPVEMIEFFGMQFPSIDYDNPYMTGLADTTAVVDFDTNSGAQGYTYFGVTAENAAGESNGAMGAVLTGAPYEMPLHESFDNGTLSYWWGVDYDDNIYDAEGGLDLADDQLVFVAPVAGWIELQSGKIALRGADNAGLSFSYAATVATAINVVAITAQGEQVVKTIEAAAGQAETVKVSLAEYAEQDWVRFYIVANFAEAGELYVDNINVMDFISDNLSIAVKAPKSVTAGKSVVVKATVLNEGENVAEGYDVKFYINDNEVPAPLFETPVLAFYESAEFEFELETSVFDEAGDVTVKAEVVYAADLKDADNADETVVTVVAPSVTPVASVAAEQTAEGVLVSWTVAENTASETTEDFESYEASTVYTTGESCGPWAAADLSQGSTYSWNSGAWDHMGESYAFGIIDFVDEGLDASFSAVSGTKAVIFMSEVNEATQSGQAADKYMISAELPGVAQTISFQALPITAQYGAETFEVLASSTDANVASFTKVAEFSTDIEDWTEFSAQLPEGTKYFAIHYTSNDIFGLFIDDLKYTVGGANPTGYNVYIDENLVGTTDAEATSYTYAEDLSVGEHSVAVTAVYGNNESAPVSVDLDVVTGIQNIATSTAVTLYTVDGIRVNNAKELKAGVYVANGKKVVVK